MGPRPCHGTALFAMRERPADHDPWRATLEDPAPVPAPPAASVAENIDKIIRIEQDASQRGSFAAGIIDKIGGFVGTGTFVIIQIAATTVWVSLNAARWSGFAPFDPFPFHLLGTVTAFEATLIAAFVLMKQNGMSTISARRDHLELQLNLRTERQAAQIIQMLNGLSAHVGFEHHHDPTGHELGQPVAIEHVADELHRRMPDGPKG